MPPTYLGESGTWFAVCLNCSRKIGPQKTATLAKKEWNQTLKVLWKEYQKNRMK